MMTRVERLPQSFPLTACIMDASWWSPLQGSTTASNCEQRFLSDPGQTSAMTADSRTETFSSLLNVMVPAPLKACNRRTPAPRPSPAGRPDRTVQLGRPRPGSLQRTAQRRRRGSNDATTACLLLPPASALAQQRCRSCSASSWYVAASSGGSARCCVARQFLPSGCSSAARRQLARMPTPSSSTSWPKAGVPSCSCRHARSPTSSRTGQTHLSRRRHHSIGLRLARMLIFLVGADRDDSAFPEEARPRAAAALAAPAAVGPARAARPASRSTPVLAWGGSVPAPAQLPVGRDAAPAPVAGSGWPGRPIQHARHVGRLLRSRRARIAHRRHIDPTSSASHFRSPSPCAGCLRHHLFGIRVVLSRTVTSRALLVAVVTSYALIVVAAGQLAEQRHDGQPAGRHNRRPDSCGPARSWLQRQIEHWVYGYRFPHPPGSPTARGPGRRRSARCARRGHHQGRRRAPSRRARTSVDADDAAEVRAGAFRLHFCIAARSSAIWLSRWHPSARIGDRRGAPAPDLTALSGDALRPLGATARPGTRVAIADRGGARGGAPPDASGPARRDRPGACGYLMRLGAAESGLGTPTDRRCWPSRRQKFARPRRGPAACRRPGPPAIDEVSLLGALRSSTPITVLGALTFAVRPDPLRSCRPRSRSPPTGSVPGHDECRPPRGRGPMHARPPR